MKLYYSSGACSLACHIALQESGLPYTVEKVDLKTKKTEKDHDFKAINPKGYVPTLELDTGKVLTEVSVILQYIADQVPQADLAPPCKTFDRYRLQEWLIYLSTEIHKSFGPFFTPDMPDKAKELARTKLNMRLGLIEEHLNKQEFMFGDHFTVIDAYLFTLMRWLKLADLKIDTWPHIAQLFEKVYNRTAVQAVLKSEGLIK